MQEGIIFDIKELAIFDGPGIRQTVFLKGCPMRCQWCHNPEGLHMKKELMISKASCLSCGRCEAACPRGCRTVLADSDAIPLPLGKKAKCNACGDCIRYCPQGLRQLAGETITSQALAERLKQSSDYYHTYGGGITFSGGEPLMQSEFLLEVLEQLEGIHKVIETCGYADFDIFRKVSAYMDEVIIDMKIFDSSLHKKYTGVGNEKIKKNIWYLKKVRKPFTVRLPLIPGVTDTIKNYELIARWLQEAPSLKKVELLSYNKLAGAKYPMLGKVYNPDFDTEKEPAAHPEIFEKYGIRSNVL